MLSASLPNSLCVLLFGDITERALRLHQLKQFQVLELSDEESLRVALSSGRAHVLIVCGGHVPYQVLPAIRRPPVIWIATSEYVEPADVVLSPDTSEQEFLECVALLGRRFQLLDELERLSSHVQDAFARYRWASQNRWHGPHELLTMALTDPLTGLFSRRHFDAALDQ